MPHMTAQFNGILAVYVFGFDNKMPTFSTTGMLQYSA